MKVVLISTYELGRQPFSLASPAAWLRARGHEVVCADLAVSVLPPSHIAGAGLVAFHLSMHTATRLALQVIDRVREIAPDVPLCAYGLYAPLNEDLLRAHGVESIIGGEFEEALADLAGGLAPGFATPLHRLKFLVPDRAGLPPLSRYAKLVSGGEQRVTGSTEASRGCKHLCRHCPIVPVYQGVFRVVQPDVVLADIGNQVSQGARHITFGDPDFFNAPTHALRIVEALHRRHAGVSYDVTIKVEHLLRHRQLLPALRDTGCAFVTSAVESVDDAVLERLDKGHTRADFYRAAEIVGNVGLVLNPTFIAFTPWTTRRGYRDLLGAVSELGLIDSTSPIQLALRLLITARSRLLELPDVRSLAGPFDPVSLVSPWRHPDGKVDALARAALHLVNLEQRAGATRRTIFARLMELAGERLPEDYSLLPRSAVPYLNEPWYC